VQPGNVHPLSRRHRARNSLGVTSRTVRPRSSSSDFAPRTAGMMEASQAILRTVSGARSSPVRVVPAPVRSARSAQSIVTTTAAFGVVGADPPAAAARRHTSTRASARRWSLVLMSAPASVEGCGAASGPRIASRTAWPSGSSRSRYSDIPSSGYGWDRERPCLSRSSRRWNSPNRPYLAMTCGRSARISRGPSDAAIATNPASTVSAHAGVNRGSSASISVSATAALPTGTRAASTASRSSAWSGLATAVATRTRAAAPPAR
jgi:hypothetical protein